MLSALGAGGMGEVYRAKDTRVERTIALKVLPEEFFEDPESIARFEREARMLASLNHPNVAHHRAGIVHRDLKPGNVMLTKSGVKLLDFGLAKVAASPVQPSPLTSQPTEVPKNLTQKGTILGTFQYMAPEELEGRDADARSDIFSFGAVLYEMATGRKAFEAKSLASLISAIMTLEPPSISTVETTAPPALERVVRTCLAKDPDERWQSAHDLVNGLRWIAEGPQSGAPAGAASPGRSHERIAWGLAAAASVAAIVMAVLLFSRRPEPLPVFRTSILPPERAEFAFVNGPMALSPDGRLLVFVAETEGKRMLWIRPLGAPTARALIGTDGAAFPFWAPDSRSLGFFGDGKLKRVDASGGSVQTLSDAQAQGGAWNRDGTILFTLRAREELYRIPAAGGNAVPVTKMAAPEFSHRSPFFLPDGNHFLYVAGAFLDGELRVGSLDGKMNKPLLRVEGDAVYTAPGYVLFARGHTLFAQGLDAGRLELKGDAVPVAEQIRELINSGVAVFSASQNGILAYQNDAGEGLSRLVWFDRTGKALESVGSPASYLHPRLSHDGKRVAVDVTDPRTSRTDIWTLSLQDRKAAPFLVTPGVDVLPRFSPDGRWIAYQSEEAGRFEVFVQAWPGPGGRWQVSSDGGREPVWRRDGKELFFIAADRVMAVPVRASSSFEFGAPKTLFQARMPDVAFCKYDVSADGQHFLVNTLVSEARSNPITLVQNWTAGVAGR